MKVIFFLAVAMFGVANAQMCGPDQFQCESGECIPSSWQCDFWEDCSDGTDEIDCNECPHQCPNGECIPESWICDDWNDCSDGSDEVNCPCDVGEVHCDNGQCVKEEYWCDEEGIWDCADGSDVWNCTLASQKKPAVVPVTPLEFENLKLRKVLSKVHRSRK